MKKILLAAAVATMPAAMMAQSAVSAYQLSRNDLRGTARFMSMGGAFGALGGDLSTLNQNPAGIGVYRSSEIGVSMNIDMQSSTVDNGSIMNKYSNTFVTCPNFGYIGSIYTGNDVMPYFQWGVSYGRIVSFNRTFAGGYGSLGTSLSNYIANFSNGYSPELLGQSNSYNPYFESYADWMSILAYNSYIINPIGNTSNYNGLFNESPSASNPNVTYGDAQYSVHQHGQVDEYSINFGGNLSNVVYWGIGFGITDIDFYEEAYYDEQLTHANIPSSQSMTGATQAGNAYYELANRSRVSGSGFNFKVGAIVKPINELRFGFAIHTPTYYNLTEQYDGSIAYSFSDNAHIPDGTAYTDFANFDWKLKTPWKLMASAATVVGGRFILSADYECDFYKDMTVKNYDGQEYTDLTSDIKYYYKPQNTIRIGAEFRVSPNFSLRAGFANSSSAVNKRVNNGGDFDSAGNLVGDAVEVITSGTNPAYTFDNSTRYITCGMGYRYKGFYIDAAYVNKHRESTYHPFTSYVDAQGSMLAPLTDFTTNDNQIVLSAGFKF